MKFAHSFAALFVLLPVFAQATPLVDARAFGGFKGGNAGQGANKGGNNAQKGGNAGNAGNAGNTGNTGNAGTAAAGGNANTGDAQSSTTLLASVIAKGFQNNGQDTASAGQVASATSSNNFINFCATVPNLPLTNGLQIKAGSCNPAPMGVIASSSNMPSAKFVVPKNGDTIAANKDFTVQMAIKHLNTGFFTNPDETYFSAPQTVDAAGDITGHSHIVIEQLTSLDQTTPTDPTKFAFFKGLNAAAVNGVLTATVAGGLPAGVYRIASINSAANHQPALVAIAQHGSLDDMAYFTVSANGAAAGTGNGTAGNNAGANKGAQTGANKGAQTGANKGAQTGANKGAQAGANKGAAGGAGFGGAQKGKGKGFGRFRVRSALDLE